MAGKLFENNYGSWAVIVGSAEGLGEAFSTALAKRGINLIMVDNQADTLYALANKIEKDFKVETTKIHLDVSEPDAVTNIMLEIQKVDCRLLIYNAAFSLIKPFVDLSEEELDKFVQVNAKAQLKLVQQFAKILIEKKQQGGILLMSSLAGLIGVQLVSSYAATKAFTWNLAEALYHELKPQGIDVLACIAGTTATPTFLKTKPAYGVIKPQIMTAEAVAESALQKLGRKALFIPGFSNRMNYFILTRLLPRRMAAAVANNAMFSMFKHKI